MMVATETRPRLRYVDFFPLPEENGRKLYGIRDPQHLSPHVLCLAGEAACALQFFDGVHTLAEIQAAYRSRYKVEFPLDLLEQLYRLLDESYFLDNETFQTHAASVASAFRAADTRAAFHAGLSYPKEPVELKKALGEFFLAPKGPGYPASPDHNRRIPGIIVPHIDLRIGGHTYAWAYKELAEAASPELVVILGTGHSGLRRLYSLTPKRFVTPLGEVPVDADFVSRLMEIDADAPFVEELAHRSEHTIEFQVLFLQQLFGSHVPIIPVLCSFSYPMVTADETAGRIDAFVTGLKKAVREDGRRVCFVASADLAHVGPRYGDNEGFKGERLEQIKHSDMEMLDYVERVDADGFLRYVSEEQDQRRICGLSPIFTMLKCMEAEKGRVVAHDHGEMDDLGSVCSYASVVFE